jgi:hypothetical protein
MAEKQNNYGINVRVQSIITHRGTGRGLPSVSLSLKEQGTYLTAMRPDVMLIV